MKNSQKHFRVRSPIQDNILSLTAILSLIALTLAAVGGVLWMLPRTGLISYDRNPFDGQTTQTAPLYAGDAIFENLRPITEDTVSDTETDSETLEIVRFSGSFSTLRSLLSDLQIPDRYQSQFETVLYSGTTEIKSAVQFYRSGDAYRIHRFAPGSGIAGNPAEIYICDGTAVWYQNIRHGTNTHFPISDSFSPEALAGIPSIASFNAIPDEQILHASYTEYADQIVYYVLYVTPTAAENRIVHEIWISADSELVMRCNTYLCGEHDDPMQIIEEDSARLFSSSMSSVSELSEKELQRLFTVPQLPS